MFTAHSHVSHISCAGEAMPQEDSQGLVDSSCESVHFRYQDAIHSEMATIVVWS